ncbi:MAG: 3-deoxy-8-phosphooctulonate synthase, partial [Bacteroidota bacterium]|nr:3-deoxy-8-phosphooctulonate synthase [Bacteroidota bacterium]
MKNFEKKLSTNNQFFLVAGPCAIESESSSMDIAEQITKITKNLNIPFVFKGSYKKANRSRINSFT